MALSYVNLTPDSTDSIQVLLRKILQRLGTLGSANDNEATLLRKLLTALNTAASGSSGTNSSGDFSVAPVWTDGATHTGLKLNVTDTSSASGSNYWDFQVGGTSHFTYDKANGFITLTASAIVNVGFTWLKIVDAASNTAPVSAELYHETSGGAGGGALNGGVSLDLRADSDTTDRQLQCRLSTLWSDATHATRTAHLRVLPTKNGTSTESLRISVDAVDIRNASALQINGVAYHNQLSVYAAGTAYTLTNASAAVDFGTTDPIFTITAAGTYLLRGKVQVELFGATFAANRTLTIKLRRTNNTAADVANSTVSYTVPVVTTITNTLAVIDLPEVFYPTALATDTITLFADISVVPSAGTITISAASITAVRLS